MNVSTDRRRSFYWCAAVLAAATVVASVATSARADESPTTAPITDKAFFAAVDAGDVATVRAALDANPKRLNAVGGRWDAPPLHYAAYEGRAEVVALLVERGADVNAHHPKWRWRPMHEAAMGGHIGIVRLLLDHGADLNVRNIEEMTPMLMAVSKGHRDVAMLLLERGSPIDDQGKDGWSLLHMAAAQGDIEVATYLLDKGLDVSIRTEAGRTPLHWAKTGEVAALLIGRGADAAARGAEGRAPMHLAAMFDRRDVVTTLIEAGAEVNVSDAQGRTPLDLAAAELHKPTAALLTSHGATLGNAAPTGTAGTRTRIGPKGQFYINNKPMIPVGVWQQPERLFTYNRALSVDCLVFPPGGGLTDTSSTSGYVAAAEKAGLGAFVHYHDNLRDMDGVWGWAGGGWPGDAAQRKYELLRRKDDSRVIICNFGGQGMLNGDEDEEAFYREVFPYIDVLVPHVWPEMFPDKPRELRYPAMLVKNVRRLCENRPGGEVSIWVDINPHEWDKGGVSWPAPTVDEFSYQVWTSLIQGADGVCLFTISFDPFVFSQIPARMEEDLPRLIAQIRQCTPMLIADESPRKITVTTESGAPLLDVTTRRHEGSDYVFLANGETEQTIRLETPGLGGTLTISDAIADKPVAAADGVYTEKVPALALRIWRITPQP